MSARLSPKRLVAAVSAVLTVYSFVRVAVLFSEAYRVVSEGRKEDYELIEVCEYGHARGSSKMREACLKASRDVASWIVFKAIEKAVGTAFKDFADTVGSPFKFAVVSLFIVSSVVLPIAPWCRALFGQSQQDIAPMNGIHYISYAPPPSSHMQRRGFRNRMGSAMRRLKLRANPRIEDADSEDDLEPGDLTSTKHAAGPSDWASINLGGNRPSSPTTSRHHKYE